MDKCYLCKSKEQDEIKYGEFLTRGQISVHYFCLLLTSNLLQRGRDDEGFLGFLKADIQEEAKRVAPAVCCFCKKKNANISCCAAKCRRIFHLTCGIKNDAENQFFGTFRSYCNRHVTGKKNRPPPPNETCCICFEEMRDKQGKFNSATMLRSPCCKNGWFHKWCLAAFAKTAGYFFKCPLCNDSKLFRQRLVYKGIFIPDRDAAWELEPNAFAELLERPKECSAPLCHAKGGRSSFTHYNKLLFCSTCGSVAIHRKCMPSQSESFECNECISVIAAVKNASVVNISPSQHTDSDDEKEIDVCGDDADDPGSNHTQIQDSDEDEGTVQPLGRIKKTENRIFDSEISSSDDNDENEDDIIPKQNVHKRKRRLVSSSTEAESLFDSGAESDRSRSSGDKFNTDVTTNEWSCSGKPQCQAEKVVAKPTQIKIPNETNMRSRRFISLNATPTENWSIAKRTRRQSVGVEINLNSYKTVPSTPLQQGRPRGRSTEQPSSVTKNKRSRSASTSSAKISVNKRHKSNSTSDQNENNYNGFDTMSKRGSLRGRSPLSSNLYGLCAFITPAYVKNRGVQQRDISSAAGVPLSTKPLEPEVGMLFSKNKSNIPQPNVEPAKPAARTESDISSTSNINNGRTTQLTFLQSYSILIDIPRKSKPHKPRNKRISHNFSNQNLPSNQTKIESFFKRI